MTKLSAKKSIKTVFVCQSCGQHSPKWMGRCSGCATWSSLVEEQVATGPASAQVSAYCGASKPVMRLSEVPEESANRVSSGMAELDRVLGGGLVRGSLVLVGGDPGIGKSTLLLQMFAALARRGETVLYVSGEESARQIKLRAERLDAVHENIYIMAETRIESALAALDEVKPSVLVIDSIQTVGSDAIESAVGSVSQIRHVTARLMEIAKGRDIITFAVGHVTKEGLLAGPKVMEHMVDTVLYFEGERGGPYRILRAHKNRFGSAQEIALFEMVSTGLVAVANPSALFLSQRSAAPGAVVVTSLEGSRPILLEVQALVTPCYPGATPRRTTTGYEPQRVAMLCAVLGARAGIDLGQADIFVNIAGGVRLTEPAVDLGIVLALASAARQVAIDPGWVAIGEVGLAGEVRAATQLRARLNEAAALGFGRALVPKADRDRLTDAPPLKTTGVAHVQEALALCELAPHNLEP